ncbi:uncharacterized protein LOC128669066 [Microplitis demolitor]|uniref:uncharacterized protein LOC128669066 n=1 Tax=Microplitis demolitor TaxID=69319 RepID=UPI00235B6162|nr:uncharacterized protein LOC128669066 [Microplitis demolitor]
MTIKIIFIIFIVILDSIDGLYVPNNNNCTYSGTDCPYLPCCHRGYKCKLINRNIYDENHVLVEQRSEYKCLARKRLGWHCSYDEECMHIKNAKCINWSCQCDWNSVGLNRTKCVLVKMW